MVELSMLGQNNQRLFSKEFHFTDDKKCIKQLEEVKQRFKSHSVFMLVHEDN